jgi:hypothetical protein
MTIETHETCFNVYYGVTMVLHADKETKRQTNKQTTFSDARQDITAALR